MDLESGKIEFVQEFLRLQNEEIVSGLENFLRKIKVELVEENLHPMTIKEYDEEMDQAESDSANGRMIEVNDLKTKIERWS